MSKINNDTIQWLVIIAAVTAGSIPAYRVSTGDGGVPATLAIIGWGMVVLVSGWQLYRNPS
jgi:hypothetical protein